MKLIVILSALLTFVAFTASAAEKDGTKTDIVKPVVKPVALVDPKSKTKPSSKAAATGTDKTTPHQVVEKVTTELMKVVHQGQDSLEKNPKKYYSDIRVIMETAVDFKYIARNVMGSTYWRKASDEQKMAFLEVFTNGLVETYAKGMATLAGFEIALREPKKARSTSRTVEVVQEFKGPKGTNLVQYKMGQHKSGQWKLLNVVLDGVNLGKVLKGQFSQSVLENKGNIDAAIAGWTIDT